MNKYTLIFACLIVLAACKVQKGNTLTSATLKSKVPDAVQTLKYPDDWYGKYKGELGIYNTTGKVMTVDMEVHILPTDKSDRSTWTIVYKMKDKAPELRKYFIQTLDAAKGEYLLDETDGIGMHEYLIDNTFYCRFAVQGVTLESESHLSGDILDYSIVTGMSDTLTVSGGTADSIPPVLDYKLINVQKARLVRYARN